MWGNNGVWQLGDGSTTNKYFPEKITPKGQSDWGGNLIDFSASINPDYVNKSDSVVTVDKNYDGYADTLYTWGENISIGSNYHFSYPTILTPKGKSDWGGNIIFSESNNTNGVATIDTDLDGYADTLYTWGDNEYGQFGNGTKYKRNEYPRIILPKGQSDWGGNIIDVSIGNRLIGVIIDTDLDGYGDTLYMWGKNNYGQIGNGTKTNILYPIIITPQNQNDWGGNIIDLELGYSNSSITIDTDNDNQADTLYMWGSNQYGELGNGITTNLLYPTIITPQNQNSWDGNITNSSLGQNNNGFIIDSNLDGYGDTLYMWGRNSYGQMGNGTTTNLLYPTIITPQNQNSWDGYLYDLDIGLKNSGILVDNNKDGFADTLYMSGNDSYGQLGNGGNSKDSNQTYFIPIASTIPNLLNSFQFYSINGKIFIELRFNDVLETMDEPVELKIIDSDGNIYNTTFIDGRSNIEEDSYYYRIDGDFNRGQTYTFDTLIIDGNSFNISNYQFKTDYLISDYKVTNVTSSEVTINLNLNENGDNFNIDKYDENQRQVKVNYTNLDLNTTYHKKVTLDDSYKIKLNNLTIDTNYQITSIQYFYENRSYKYKIEQDSLNFRTNEAIPTIISNSFTVIDYSINDNSFNYTVEIDNLKPSEIEEGFENYNINNGIWLIDDNNNIYNSIYLDYQKIGNSEYEGYYNYQFVFNQNGLNSNTTYLFTGITLDNLKETPNQKIYNFNSLISVTTTGDKEQEPLIIDNSISVIENSITSNSFNYVIQIDNLKLENESNLNDPIFSNFNPKNGLYLKNNLGQIFRSDYILESEIYLGNGTAEGTSKYQFSFQINGLNSDTIYTFTEAKIITNNDYVNINDLIVKTSL